MNNHSLDINLPIYSSWSSLQWAIQLPQRPTLKFFTCISTVFLSNRFAKAEVNPLSILWLPTGLQGKVGNLMEMQSLGQTECWQTISFLVENFSYECCSHRHQAPTWVNHPSQAMLSDPAGTMGKGIGLGIEHMFGTWKVSGSHPGISGSFSSGSDYLAQTLRTAAS